MKRLTFKIIAEYLSVRDNRTVKTWCKRHGVKCFKDGKCWYVFESDFLAHCGKVPEVEKNNNFTEIKVKRFIPTTEIAKDFERTFSHIPAS